MSRTIASSDFRSDVEGTHDTLIALLRDRAEQQPARSLYTFLADGETEELSLTCGELDRQARRIAAHLQSLGATGERVLLLYPPGLDYIAAFFGCLYAGAVAVPAYPPRLNRNLGRLQAIADDAEATVALTTSAILARVQPLLGEIPHLRAIRWLATDEMDGASPEDWREPAIDGETLAFLQYTSGSTARPKGVMVTHANLLRNEEMIRYAFAQSSDSIIVGWLPMYHDMGLIGNVLQPLFLNARCVLFSPTAFLQRPMRWLQAISKYRATTSGGPNFAYELCASRVTPEQCTELDLSSWSVAFNGAEPVRAETLERFAETFAPCGFRRDAFQPCYGLAEATLIVSGGRLSTLPTVRAFSARAMEQHRIVEEGSDEAARVLVGCGRTLPDEVVIVEPESLTRAVSGGVGEIWVAGSSVARGYWNREEETARTFDAHLLDTGEGPFLRTGDLGFLKDGELFIAGRIKDLIVIRGRNLYPHDIELTVERSHAALRPGCGAAFAFERDGEERLAIVQEVDNHRASDIEEVLASIRQAVSEEHEAPLEAIVLIKAGTIPKTSSGKIQRHACRVALENDSLASVGEWRRTGASEIAATAAELPSTPHSPEEIEEWLASRLAAWLGVSVSEIDVTQPITRYGLDSLFAVELAHAIETSLGVVIPVSNLLRNASVSELAGQAFAQMWSSSSARRPHMLGAHTADADQPLSSGQRALWFLHELAPESAAYNLTCAARIASQLDAEALHRAFQALSDRHASLRTTFRAANGAPAQHVQERMTVGWMEADASLWSDEVLDERLDEEARRPFNLEQESLLRVGLFTRGASEHVMLLCVHHIVADFWSLAILMDELGRLYEAEIKGTQAALPPLKLEYTDYSRWQAEMLAGDEGKRLWDFWRERLGGELPALDLPLDHRRPAVQTYTGAAHSFELDAELTDKLKSLSRAHGTTLYTTLLAAFYTLLYRYTGQEDIVVGSPTAGRSASELNGLVGYFVNPVVLRANPSADATFEDFLAEVREVALASFAHQDYPFPVLVERLQPERDASRSPLFQAMFVLYKSPLAGQQGLASFALGEDGGSVEVGGLRLESVALKLRIAQFDLTLMMAESGGSLIASLQYNTDLFEAATIARMREHFENLLRGIVAHPAGRLSALPLLNGDEQRQLVSEWNETKADYPHDQTIHGLFERQAAQMPDAVALVAGHERLTYSTLNNRANQLARYLRRAGVSPEVTVGICMERTPAMVVALLGVLKAGGAYVPLDPAYPKARVAFMLEDARAHVLLHEGTTSSAGASAEGALAIDLDAAWETIAAESTDDLPHDVAAENLAYVIYTSGTTGRPKGVAIAHRNAVALIAWAKDVFSPQELAGVLASTSICFDLSVFELFVTLCCGGKVVLADNALHLAELPAADEVVLVNTVPSAMTELLKANQIPASVRTVNLAGEPLLSHLVQEVYAEQFVERLFNLYGPSEDTTYSTFALMSKGGDENSLIGRPISNTQVYLFDTQLQPVPVGVPGEVYIGGDGLARGYLHRPELTAEKFVPHPFSDKPGARLYRTQDLARRLPDGNIVFLGRIDNQVKIRGYRVELGEVETILSQHAKVREAVVVAREDVAGDKRLVAYAVVERGQTTTAAELRNSMHERLPDFMLPSAIVLMDALPLTPNGKVDRRALPAPDFGRTDADASFVAPRSAFEEAVAEAWVGVLGASRIGVHDNFFELGGHSLLATQVIARLRQVFQIELPLSMVFEKPTIAELAEGIEQAIGAHEGEEWPPIEHVAHDGALPLSFAQQRLWFLDQLEPGNAAYNMPIAVSLRGQLDVAALSRALDEVVRRHQSLRTSFALSPDGHPAQFVLPHLAISLPLLDLSSLPSDDRLPEARRLASLDARLPFRLSHPPLLRARLLRLDSDLHQLILVIHHIVSDGWSMRLLVRELAALYHSFARRQHSPLPDLPLHYPDYALWQRRHLDDAALLLHLDYWRSHLAAPLPVLHLPADHPRPLAPTHRAARLSHRLSPHLTARLKESSQRHGVTLFMTLLAAFDALLARYTGQTDIIVGTPVANRHRLEIEPLIGFFVNTLALRTDLSGDPTFSELMARVRETALGAYRHQEAPFERVVEAVAPARDMSRAPVFQVMLVLQEAALAGVAVEGLEVEVMEVETGAAKFDLLVGVQEQAGGEGGGGGGMEVCVDYSAELFEAGRIGRLLGHFERLLESAVAEPQRRVSEMEMLSAQERAEQLEGWNATAREYERETSVHEMFERAAERLGEAEAVVCGEERVTYGEMNRRANRVARRLRAHGVGIEERVGVLVGRGTWMVAGMLGVMKAGCAYVPLDGSYPAERMREMMEDAGVRVVVVTEGMRGRVPPTGAAILCLESDCSEATAEDDDNPRSGVTAGNVAYVIYTSGSTGRPKGVAIEHRSAVAFSHWARESFDRESFDGVLALTSICFDISIFELFVPLHWGGKVILVENALEVATMKNAHEVKLVNTVPSAITELLRLGALPKSARTINLAGEPLPKKLVEQLYEQPQIEKVLNFYGPTEDTTYSTWGLMERTDEPITIGRPIHNTRVYLLDSFGQIVPVGVPGILHLGGSGLARGYLGRPDMTAERFVPDSFGGEPGARLYNTGDLARYLPDGRLDFIGRIDHQVKIRGFRIELGEIETALRRHAAVQECVVVAREDAPGDKRIVAYVAGDDERLSTAGLRQHLGERLPGYMMPSAFVLMAQLPLTTNGKINRRALPAPDALRAEDDESFVAPRTPVEEKLARIWCAELKIESVGIHNNFFELGGHSLLATRVVSAVRENFGVEVALRSLFETPTIEHLAKHIEQQMQQQSNGNAGKIQPRSRSRHSAQLREQLKQLSDEEIKNLLEEKKHAVTKRV